MILELVIFDMDGLMFDTEPLGAVCFARAAKQFGYIIEEEFRYKLIGINANDHYALMKSKFGQDCPAKEIHELSKKLRSDYLYKHGIVIKPGLFELITYLKNKGIKIAVASSSAYSKINEYLALAGLKNIFDLIVGGDDLEHGKPDPEIFLKYHISQHFKSLFLLTGHSFRESVDDDARFFVGKCDALFCQAAGGCHKIRQDVFQVFAPALVHEKFHNFYFL